jgi:Kef-type K+ transport system membrane component KefB
VHEQSIAFTLFLIFTGAALTATLALWARQALIIGYIALGILFGPWGLSWISDTATIANMSEIGIIFLLFLLGLNLTPQKLLQLLRQTLLVTCITSFIFCAAGWLIARAFGFSALESLLVGVAAMFSSTIVGIKLLPTTVLHHRHTGEVIISVLLLQDLIAILVLLALQGLESPGSGFNWFDFGRLALSLPLLIGVAYALDRYVLLPLFHKFSQVQEYVFLLTLAWCLGIAQFAHSIGLSYEMGAFIAGITVATSPIALFIAESLKPLRDFFLVLFFFALGASLDLEVAADVVLPAAMLGLTMLALKPVVFRYLLGKVSESPKLAWETGWRLGQMSEFSLLITFLAMQSAQIGLEVVIMIQLATLITFVGSSSIIVLNFPTPVAASQRLRRD